MDKKDFVHDAIEIFFFLQRKKTPKKKWGLTISSSLY